MNKLFTVAEPRSEEDLAKDKEYWDNNPVLWRCYSCGTTSDKTEFHTEKTWTDYGYEYDCVCDECGSDYTLQDGEGEPVCDCGNFGWWCDECNKAMCEECWNWFPATEEPLENLCKECEGE